MIGAQDAKPPEYAGGHQLDSGRQRNGFYKYKKDQKVKALVIAQ